jgi:hypothetical protein
VQVLESASVSAAVGCMLVVEMEWGQVAKEECKDLFPEEGAVQAVDTGAQALLSILYVLSWGMVAGVFVPHRIDRVERE